MNENQYSQNQPLKPQSKEQGDVYSYPLPARIKHPSWSVRKSTYEQILYLIKELTSPAQQILISGNAYTLQTLLPYFQNLIQEKHAMVLLKGLECVEQIVIMDKKLSSKHCIKSLIDKGIQYFPLLTQQRKAILQKFLDIVEMGKVDAAFLKNKLNLPHEKSVMYVIEVIGVLNMTSLQSTLVSLSKKHQKKCVRQLALQIAQQLQPQFQPQQQPSTKSKPQPKPPQSPQSTCKYTIQKLPHYQQLATKKQQQFSSQLAQKIDAIIEQYSLSQLPNFSHIIRLMIDDNNHIINVNAIKCLVAVFGQEAKDAMKASLLPVSFPLLFLFAKFKSHKTHPINALLLTLVEAILQSSPNRVTDLFFAISEGLSSAGSKANVKFGCALAFFRVISLLYQNEDLYACTANQNLQNQAQDISQKFQHFSDIKLGKNLQKYIQKIMTCLQKQKKYDTQVYLIRYAIGLDVNTMAKSTSGKQLMINNSSTKMKQSTETVKKGANRPQINNHARTSSRGQPKKPNISTKQTQRPLPTSKSVSLSKTLTNPKNQIKFSEINLQSTLHQILKHLSTYHNQYQQSRSNHTKLDQLLQKSSQQFYQCVRQRRYEMFYLCELLQDFIQNYQPHDLTIEKVSEYLINVLKIVSILKPMVKNISQSGKDGKNQVQVHNVSQLLLVALCKLVICQELNEILENLSMNYSFELIYDCLRHLFLQKKDNKVKKKNKKFLLQWLQNNTPALFLNAEYDKLIQSFKQKQSKPKPKPHVLHQYKQSFPQARKQTKPSLSPKNQQKSRKFQLSPISSSKKQPTISFQLQNINLSKIEKNPTQSHEYDQDFEKSSFHQNLEEQLKQISTQRSNIVEENNYVINQKPYQQNDMSREYLKYIKNDKELEKKEIYKESQPSGNEGSSDNDGDDQGYRQLMNKNQRNNGDSHSGQQEHDKSVDYEEKCKQVERRRLEREQQRKQFMNRMKYQFKPMMDKSQDHSQKYSQKDLSQQSNSKNSIHNEEVSYNNQQTSKNSHQQSSHNTPRKQQKSLTQKSQHSFSRQEQDKYLHTKSPLKNNFTQPYEDQQSGHKQSQLKGQQSLQREKVTNMPQDSIISSTSSGSEFRYRLINMEKLAYMLKTTTNPYPHLRTLILIPFKSSSKKHQFLKELIHFFSNHVEFKLPQPYNAIVLLTILLFSEIREDKTLIQPLQSLYELVAKQSTTNDFIKTIISLFHSVIEETMQQNRKFLITILLKSMIRMLPFIEDGLALLRDIQQFYQIGEMVYFEMFEEEYEQIKTYIQQEVIHFIVQKAIDQQGDNLHSIIQGWLATQWKTKVIEAIHDLGTQDDQHQQQHEQNQQENHQYQQSQQKYTSYI